MKNAAAVSLGRKGGKARVPKGFSMLTADQKSATSRAAALIRRSQIKYLCGCTASGAAPGPLPSYCPEHPTLTRDQALAVGERIMRRHERVSAIADSLLAAFEQGAAKPKAELLDLCQEIADHMYEKQDYARCRVMAREIIAKAQGMTADAPAAL